MSDPLDEPTRKAVATRILFDAALSRFEAGAWLRSNSLQEESRAEAHARLDVLLDAKADQIMIATENPD